MWNQPVRKKYEKNFQTNKKLKILLNFLNDKNLSKAYISMPREIFVFKKCQI